MAIEVHRLYYIHISLEFFFGWIFWEHQSVEAGVGGWKRVVFLVLNFLQAEFGIIASIALEAPEALYWRRAGSSGVPQ